MYLYFLRFRVIAPRLNVFFVDSLWKYSKVKYNVQKCDFSENLLRIGSGAKCWEPHNNAWYRVKPLETTTKLVCVYYT